MGFIQLFLLCMEITDKMIGHLLHLARLEAIPGKQETLRTDVQKMVQFIEQLNEVNTTGVAPLQYMGKASSMRGDALREGVSREVALANAPVPHDTYFKVPTVIKK